MCVEQLEQRCQGRCNVMPSVDIDRRMRTRYMSTVASDQNKTAAISTNRCSIESVINLRKPTMSSLFATLKYEREPAAVAVRLTSK